MTRTTTIFTRLQELQKEMRGLLEGAATAAPPR